jgi:hypothetical protein
MSSQSRRRPGVVAAAALAGVVAFQLLAVFSFAYVRTAAEPTDLPIAVVAPEPAAGEIATTLTERAEGALDVSTYASAEEARAAILDRDTYGALVFPEGPPDGDAEPEVTLLVAGAASPQLATMLGDLLGPAVAAQGATLTVEDVRPADPDDPSGAALLVTALPLVLTSLGAGLLPALLAPGRRGVHALALVSFAAAGGTLIAFLLVDGLGVLPGSTWELAGVLALGMLALALTGYASERLLGRAGLGLAMLVMLLIGVQAAGVPAPELLPDVWRQLGPWLPPLALVSTLRNVAYFDAAAITTPLTVLGAYAAVGALALIPWRRRGRGEHDAVTHDSTEPQTTQVS